MKFLWIKEMFFTIHKAYVCVQLSYIYFTILYTYTILLYHFLKKQKHNTLISFINRDYNLKKSTLSSLLFKKFNFKKLDFGTYTPPTLYICIYIDILYTNIYSFRQINIICRYNYQYQSYHTHNQFNCHYFVTLTTTEREIRHLTFITNLTDYITL